MYLAPFCVDFETYINQWQVLAASHSPRAALIERRASHEPYLEPSLKPFPHINMRIGTIGLGGPGGRQKNLRIALSNHLNQVGVELTRRAGWDGPRERGCRARQRDWSRRGYWPSGESTQKKSVYIYAFADARVAVMCIYVSMKTTVREQRWLSRLDSGPRTCSPGVRVGQIQRMGNGIRCGGSGHCSLSSPS